MRYTQELLAAVQEHGMLMEVMNRAGALGLGNYYIGAGCIVQTVWNRLTGRPLAYGIEDVDIVYYDGHDLSYEAEDRVIEAGRQLFEDLPVRLDIKNQARVHVWYTEKYGIPLAPYTSVEDAIDSWPATASSLGLRRDTEEKWTLYAPFGLEDLFHLMVRPNKKLIDEPAYLAKVSKWLGKWPELTAVGWNDAGDPHPLYGALTLNQPV